MKFEIRVKQTLRVERYCDLIVSADTLEEAASKASREAEDGFYRFHDTDTQVLEESAGPRPEGMLRPLPEFAVGDHVYLRYSAQGTTDEDIEITLPENVIGLVGLVAWVGNGQGWQYWVEVAGITECINETNRKEGKLPIETARLRPGKIDAGA